jgi:hypothetical protein
MKVDKAIDMKLIMEGVKTETKRERASVVSGSP